MLLEKKKRHICGKLRLDRGVPKEMVGGGGNTRRKESPLTVIRAEFWCQNGEIGGT